MGCLREMEGVTLGALAQRRCYGNMERGMLRGASAEGMLREYGRGDARCSARREER